MRPVAVEAEVQPREAEIAAIVQPEVDAIGEDPAGIRGDEHQAASGGRVAVKATRHRVTTEEGAVRIGDVGGAADIIPEAVGNEIAAGRLRNGVRDPDM